MSFPVKNGDFAIFSSLIYLFDAAFRHGAPASGSASPASPRSQRGQVVALPLSPAVLNFWEKHHEKIMHSIRKHNMR